MANPAAQAHRGRDAPLHRLLVFAALAEIAGCYAFWIWIRSDRSALWLAPGLAALAAFARALARMPSGFSGRT